jgi:hypothetical protein
MLKTGFACLLIALSISTYAQRKFTVASPFAEVSAEQKRLDSLGYRAAYVYELADSAQPNGKRYLMGRYEYGVDGVVAVKIDYGFDTDSTAWYYAYDNRGRVTQASMISRRAISQSSYYHNRRTGRLDSIIVTSGDQRKQLVKYNKNGMILEFDTRRIDYVPDTTSKRKKDKRITTPIERTVFAYDTMDRIVADTIYSLGPLKQESPTSFTQDVWVSQTEAYTYDEFGRMTSWSRDQPGLSSTVEYYFYDDKGDLARRIDCDLTKGTRIHYVLFYK